MKSLILVALAVTPIWVHEIQAVRVIDGDTFVARILVRPGLTEDRTVRLDCGNAPELRADGGGIASKAALTAALDGGLTLHTQWQPDKYGRLLGAPWRGDTSICGELRDGGFIR